MVFQCKICNKIYSSYKSLWQHNKSFHPQSSTNSTTITQKSTIVPDNISVMSEQNKQLQCIYCNKKLSRIDSKTRHEKNCKHKDQQEKKEEKNDDKIKLEILKEEVNLKKEEIKLRKEEAKILKLKLKQQKKENETPTISKINNIIINININTDNANQMNPGIYEIQKPIDFNKIMSISRMKYIVKQGYGSLESYIEFLHCGKINQFKNIIITNLKNDIIYVFDSKTCQYIADVKRKVIKSLIENRMSDIENILGLISNEIDDKTKKIIKNFIKEMQDNKKFINDGIAYENYCEFMTEKIILLLYNNHKKVLTDISTHIEKIAIQDKPTIEEI